MCVCDLHNVSRLALSSVDMEQRDYDLRTALHVAAAEGETLQKKQTTLDGTFYSAKPRNLIRYIAVVIIQN